MQPRLVQITLTGDITHPLVEDTAHPLDIGLDSAPRYVPQSTIQPDIAVVRSILHDCLFRHAIIGEVITTGDSGESMVTITLDVATFHEIQLSTERIKSHYKNKVSIALFFYDRPKKDKEAVV